AAQTANGETWRCEVTPNDGEADGPTAFDEVTIGNTAPGPLVVQIEPATPLTTDDLQVSVTGGDDPDDQPITHRYRWSRDGQSQADLDDATTVPADRTANGETWRCEVTPNDGEADGPSAFDEVTIGNTAPLITGVSISPDPAATTDDLQATPSGWFDADGDQEGYLWSWERRSGDQWLPIAGATTATLTSDLFAAGDELRVICIPDDGTAPGEAARAEIVIANTPPGVPAESVVTPAEPTSADDLTVAASGAEDADGEELAWEHQWRRSTDGGSTWDTWGRDGSTLASSLTSVGETWQARSRASDGASEGPWLESNMVGICDRVAHSFGAGVQLVGLPLQPLDPAPGAVFPGCEVAGDWTGSAYSQPDSIDCGRGYWSNFPTPMDVSLRGRLAEGDSMTVGLAGTGWHMLGNPFTDALSWPNVVGDGLLPYGWIWEADLQSYRLVANLDGLNITGEIPPWSGFWVKLASAATDVTMSRGAAPASQSQPMSLEPVAPEDWVLRLTARAGDCADVDNFIGVLSQGALRIEEPPTSAGDSVALYCAAAGGGRDAVSIVASATATLSWDLVVQTNLANVPVVVQYPDLSTVPGEWKLYLVDLETGARRYMRTTERYEFMAGESGANRHLRLEAVQEADGPAMITSLAARPSSSGVEVCYTLTGAASVDAEVLNISGRTVRVLGRDRVSPAGETRLSWNLVSDAGTAVPNGTYLCRITARTETGMRTDRIVTLQIAR
ncbi:MAG: hypothetical protein GX131_07015, partial [candidate division WS1 bacterium]|nr:hypothetical protein [candidate division WS1 bacterium]